ncbi:MAG: class I SAM-dependent methyltransferase [Clostridia bacterium]
MNDLSKNAARFYGFAGVYDQARPKMPHDPIEIICRYLGRKPELAVDLGCGTGLSTQAWHGNCGRVIGVEPSGDMLAVARQKEDDQLCFIQSYAHQTGLPDACADAVICSQSFHWMDPALTLAEVNRILKPGGVFATVDCDWPPVCDWQAELAYCTLFDRVRRLEKTDPDLCDQYVRWEKSGHLSNIQNSGYFRYCRELVFLSRETGNTDRLIALSHSQGSLQNILKRKPALIADALAQFESDIRSICGEKTFEMDFCYRMRIGIK